MSRCFARLKMLWFFLALLVFGLVVPLPVLVYGISSDNDYVTSAGHSLLANGFFLLVSFLPRIRLKQEDKKTHKQRTKCRRILIGVLVVGSVVGLIFSADWSGQSGSLELLVPALRPVH